MSIADKLITIAENQSKVYDAGKLALLRASTHMNGTASGAPVSVSDVSPVEHEVTVQLSSDTATDFSGVSVSRYGANRFNIHATDVLTNSWSGNTVARKFQENTWYIGLTTNNYWSSNSLSYSLNVGAVTVTPTTNGYGISQAFKCLPHQTYYLSREKTNDASTGCAFYDAEGNWLSSTTNLSFTTPDNCYWLTVFLGGSRNVEHTFTKVQLSPVPITEYAPYMEPTTHMASADGTVAGITSVSPAMTLVADTDDVVVECSYLRDIDRFIDTLTGGDN